MNVRGMYDGGCYAGSVASHQVYLVPKATTVSVREQVEVHASIAGYFPLAGGYS